MAYIERASFYVMAKRSVPIRFLESKRIIPLAFTFTQKWIYENRHKLMHAENIHNLRQDYESFFLYWIKDSFPKTLHNFKEWELRNFPTESRGYHEEYRRFEIWIDFLQKNDPEHEKLGLWKAGKDVTFDACLFIISRCDNIFPKRLLKIIGYFKDPSALIEWNIDLKDFIQVTITP